MQLDIRLPIGLLFAVFGVLLLAFGLFSDKALYERSLQVNVNLWWGLVMLLFGVVMFALGRRGHRRPETTAAETMGKSATEHK
jgi:multisubunit Na+/H+ antiporter MnhG subunit